MKTLEKWLKNLFNQKIEVLFSLLIGVFVSIILWVTLVSREVEYPRSYWVPFWSYINVFKGNWKWLLENIGNVVVFIPLGFLFKMISIDKKQGIYIFFAFSFFIEVTQLLTGLGSFEVDDLIHNTVGGLFGFGLCLDKWKRKIQLTIVWKYCISVILCITVISLSVNKIYDNYQYSMMLEYAALSDELGKKNLLLMNGKDGYCSNADVYVKFLDDGSISIKGTSETRAWYRLGQQTLPAGIYEFSGLEGALPDTVAIMLEFRDKNSRKYIQKVSDVGFEPSVVFSLMNDTDVRSYVRIYPGCDCDVIARPVIFRLGE